MAAYVVGQTYEYSPGQWGVSLDGNGLFKPVSDPNAAQKETQRKADAAAAAYRIYNGDLTAIADYEKAMSMHMDPNAYKSWVGNRDQLDSIINAKFVAAPTGYTTKLKEAQGYADQAKEYARIYSNAKAVAASTGAAISQEGLNALSNMTAELKKEEALIGGGYAFNSSEDYAAFADALSSGKTVANSYASKEFPKQKTVASTTSPTATTFANAQTYASSGNGMTEAATTTKGTDTDAYSVTNRATTQGMVGFNQGSTYDTDNRSAVQKYSQALQGNQLGTTSSNKSKNTVANRYAVSNIFR